jgi:hypothetical protein
MKSLKRELISSGLRSVGNQLQDSSSPKLPAEFPRTFTGDQTNNPAVETLIGASYAGFSSAKAYASSWTP